MRLNLEGRKPSLPSQAEIRWQVGLLSSVLALAFNLLARFAFGAPSVPELMTERLFAVVPISLVEFAVSLLGIFAKHFAFIGCAAIYVALLTVAATAFLHRSKKQGPVSIALFTLFIWFFTLVCVVPSLGFGFFGRNLPMGVVTVSLWLFFVYSLYGFFIGFFGGLFVEQTGKSVWLSRVSERWLSRRQMMAGLGYTLVAAGVYDIVARPLWQWLRQSAAGLITGGSGIFPSIDGLAREVSPTADFYQVSKNAFDPHVEVHSWKLDVGGLVENPLSMTYSDIKALPAIEQYATLECISNTVGGPLIDNALWRGVKLKDVLERAHLKPGVLKIVLHASDHYSDSIPLGRALEEGTLLAYAMNGEALNAIHGYPLRLIVPGIYGMKNVKWITKIEAVDYDFKGYWQARGWDDKAEYKTMSRIDVPRKSFQGKTTIAGIAFAGDRGVRTVETSKDGGETWEQAEIKPAVSPYSWVLWHQEWTPAHPGNHALVVRATDGAGHLQIAEEAPPIPDGASGFHHRKVKSG
ncbi:MAG: molybdopterin-dependent oxidoreductase [Acidobacteriia bacterium]|nr:molybdopterin-dependent oxidoreductase [Terriglobia bacterium]